MPNRSLQAVMSGRAGNAACVHLLSPFSRVHREPRGAKAVFLCLVGTAPSTAGSEGVQEVVGELRRGGRI